MNIYGVIINHCEHRDVSRTERGAKNYATRHGYSRVSVRYGGGLIAQIIAVKKNGGWVASNA